MFKTFNSKIKQLRKRSWKAQAYCLECRTHSSSSVHYDIDTLNSATLYQYKIETQIRRMERQLAKKLGLPEVPMLCRGGFKLMRQYKIILREKGELFANEWYRNKLSDLLKGV